MHHARKERAISQDKYNEIRAFVIKHPDVETLFLAEHYGYSKTIIQYIKRMTWEEYITYKARRLVEYHERKARMLKATAESAEAGAEDQDEDGTQTSIGDLIVQSWSDDELDKDYSFESYQRDRAKFITANNPNEMIQHALFGLCAKVGELHGLYQHIYENSGFSTVEAKHCIGGVLWMLTELAEGLNLSLGKIAQTNVRVMLSHLQDDSQQERDA